MSMKLSWFDERDSTFAYLIGTSRSWVESLIRRSERYFGLSLMKHVVVGLKGRKGSSCARARAEAASSLSEAGNRACVRGEESEDSSEERKREPKNG